MSNELHVSLWFGSTIWIRWLVTGYRVVHFSQSVTTIDVTACPARSILLSERYGAGVVDCILSSLFLERSVHMRYSLSNPSITNSQ
jgi:hypothetical protein